MHLKMSSGKRRPSCLGLNVLTGTSTHRAVFACIIMYNAFGTDIQCITYQGINRKIWIVHICFNLRNSLAPERCNCGLQVVIFKLISRMDISSISPEIGLNWTPHDHFDDKSTLHDLGNGLVPSGNKPLPESMFAEICDHLASLGHSQLISYLSSYCPACRTTLVATRFRVAVICPIIQVPHCIRVFFYFVWFVFINHIFSILSWIIYLL